jgi:hypothetical protein
MTTLACHAILDLSWIRRLSRKRVESPQTWPRPRAGAFLSAVEQCIERRADRISASAEPMVNGYGVEGGAHHLGTKKTGPDGRSRRSQRTAPDGVGGLGGGCRQDKAKQAG